MFNPSDLQGVYPWTASPLIVSAPMAKVAMPKLAVAVSKAGGLGFIAAGYFSDHLEDLLEEGKGPTVRRRR
jgi:Dioxygenases related to 2-nitropropane dioxygenase